MREWGRFELSLRWDLPLLPTFQPKLLLFLLLLLTPPYAGCQDYYDTYHGLSPRHGHMSGAVADGRSCYSCMSEVYGQMWEAANYKALYLLPKRSEARTLSFTDHCRDPSQRPRDIASHLCPPNTVCVSMKEKFKLDMNPGFGTYGYIRGCLDQIFLWGYNRTGKARHLWRNEGCEVHNLSSLVQGHDPGSFHDSELLVCTCYGSLCNGYDRVAAAARPQTALLIPIALLLLTLFS